MIDKLKQRLAGTSSKLRRYEARTEQYIQGRMFQTNQAKLEMEMENRSNDIRLGSQESLRFWSGTWDQPVIHNDAVKWLKKVRETNNRNSEAKKHQS